MARLRDLPPELHTQVASYIVFDCSASIKHSDYSFDAVYLGQVSDYWKKIVLAAADHLHIQTIARKDIIFDTGMAASPDGQWNMVIQQMIAELERYTDKQIVLRIELLREMLGA